MASNRAVAHATILMLSIPGEGIVADRQCFREGVNSQTATRDRGSCIDHIQGVVAQVSCGRGRKSRTWTALGSSHPLQEFVWSLLSAGPSRVRPDLVGREPDRIPNRSKGT